MTTEFYTPERVLVIVAHADDIEFGASGTIARWTAAGSVVTYCVVTDNSAGSNVPNADLQALSRTRAAEQTASAAVVGVTDVRFLGYQDGILEPTLALRRELTRVIRQVRPDVVMMIDPTTVITSDGGYINHPDHRAASEAGLYAVFPSGGTRPIFPELLDEGLEPHDTKQVYLMLSEKPNLVVDISETHARKLEALRCHASQLDDAVLEMVQKWDADAGKANGYAYAETFRVLRLRD